jgi:hypothetical protein
MTWREKWYPALPALGQQRLVRFHGAPPLGFPLLVQAQLEVVAELPECSGTRCIVGNRQQILKPPFSHLIGSTVEARRFQAMGKLHLTGTNPPPEEVLAIARVADRAPPRCIGTS